MARGGLPNDSMPIEVEMPAETVPSVRYTLGGASWLLKVPQSTLKRWANGYTYQTRYGEIVAQRGVLLGDREEGNYFTFLDLMELRVVKHLIRRLPTDRDPKKTLSDLSKIAENLAPTLGDYPLVRADFRRVGEQLVTDRVSPDLFTNVLIMQHLLEFADEIVESIEFGADRLPTRWYPMGDDRIVRIDPRIRFGRPTVTSGVTTDAISRRYKIEDEDAEETAEWFGISEEEVRAAVDFEDKWAA